MTGGKSGPTINAENYVKNDSWLAFVNGNIVCAPKFVAANFVMTYPVNRIWNNIWREPNSKKIMLTVELGDLMERDLWVVKY